MINLVGVPFETEANFLRGAALGPAHLRWHLWGIDEYSPLQKTRMPSLHDAGDLWVNFDLKPEERLDRIAVRIKSLFARNDPRKAPYLFLGGDHTITWATVRALRDWIGDFAVLHLDAHLDRWDDYGGRFSHATVMRRLEEEGFTVGTFGYRTVGSQEYVPKYGNMYDLSGALDFVKTHGKVYLSLDVDVLDPSEFPCVSNPEPMGVRFVKLLKLLYALKGRLLGAEIVEYLPTLDHSHRCGSVGAILMRELSIVLSAT